LFR
jgi:hypothetical protein